MKTIKMPFLLFYLGIEREDRTLEVEGTVALLARLLNKTETLDSLRDSVNAYYIQARNEGIEVETLI